MPWKPAPRHATNERRRVRATEAAPKVEALKARLEADLDRLPAKGAVTQTIHYALTRWLVLCRYLGDGRIEIDNNAAERAIRPVALGRKNWLFAGSDQGGHRAAGILSLVETAKLSSLDPERSLRDVLTRIANHPINRIGSAAAVEHRGNRLSQPHRSSPDAYVGRSGDNRRGFPATRDQSADLLPLEGEAWTHRS